MGYLLNGVWQDGWYDSAKTGGEFIQPEAAFRDCIVGKRSSVFAAEHRHYHLYVSLACPWARRTLVFRKLKQLEDATDRKGSVEYRLAEWRIADAPPDPPGPRVA